MMGDSYGVGLLLEFAAVCVILGFIIGLNFRGK